MLILASASPRRHDLLQSAGIAHAIRTASIDEAHHAEEAPIDYVRRLAEAKARAVQMQDGEIILGADTTVAIDDRIFGKPVSVDDAAQMLRALSGRDHYVYTGICLWSREKCTTDVAATRVTFLELTDNEIKEYIKSGEPNDKAGGYAIQGLASKFIAGIEGCYQNVVGLPVSLVYRNLKLF